MNKFKITGLSFIFLTLFSCKKVIDVKETDFIGGDIALQTVENNEQTILGAYAIMSPEMSILLNATFSDEVRKGEFYNAGTTHEWQYTSTDIGIRDNFTAFNLYYRAIDRVNRVLEKLASADSTRVGDNSLRARLRGEALFIRAFSHFDLYRFYSGATDPNALALAYVETPTLEPKARMKVGEYFTKLKADMTEAKMLLPTTLPSAETPAARATKLAVTGLQARAALYLKEWGDAITFSTEYINALPLATKAQFPGIWTDANNVEVAFRLKRSNTQSGYIRYDQSVTSIRLGSLFRGTSANATTIGTISWLPSEKLINTYDKSDDVRYSSYFVDDPTLKAAGRPSLIIKKYAGGAYGTPAENVADAKVFRTGEMYLIRAEAKAETNDLAGAAADLNALRDARITNYIPEVFLSKADLISAIVRERFKELAFEGHRFWDLRRKNLAVERTGVDVPTSNGATLPAGNFRFVLPIPNAEIQANSLIVQNAGYTN